MFSKFLRPLVIAFIMLQLGCGLKTGEAPKQQDIVQFNDASCVKNSIDNLKKFFAGDATDDQVGEAVECLQTAIKAFKENVRGADRDKYTPDEVSQFILRKFLKSDIDLSPSLLSEIMKLKVLLASGDSAFITRPELDSVSTVLARLKPELVRLNPHIKVFVSKWQMPPDKAEQLAQFNAAKDALKTSLSRIGQMLSATERGLQVTDLLQLVAEVVKLGKTPSPLLDTLAKAQDLILKLKTNLIGGTTEIKGPEWQGVLSLAAVGFSETLRFHYFLEPLTLEQVNERLDVYQATADDVSKLIPELLQGHTSQINNDQINEIIIAAQPLLPALKNVKPDLIDQVGKLKLVFLGNGDSSYSAWTVSDFNILNERLPDFFTIPKSLKYYKFDIKGFRGGTLKKEDFLKAEDALNKAIQNLSDKILFSYDLEDLKKFAISFKAVAGEELKLPANLDDWFKLVYAGKVALTGEPGTKLSVKNLQLLLNVGIRIYGNVVELADFVLPFKIDEPQATSNIGPWLLKLKDSLSLELNLKPSHEITTAELIELVVVAQDTKILQTSLQRSSLESFLNAVWGRVLTKPKDRLDGNAQKAFTQETLNNMATEIGIWLENQKFIFQLFDAKPEYSKQELVDIFSGRLGTRELPLPARLSLAELNRVVSARGNMNFNEKGFLKILTPDSGMYHLRDLTNSNVAKTAARILIESFSMDMNNIQNYTGITQAEAQNGFDQFKSVLFDLGILDRGDEGFISSRFTEANLFLSVSNGDSYASFEELHHIILHIISGLARAKEIEPKIISKCVLESAPIKIKSVLSQNCLLDVYFQEDEAFQDLPEFLRLKTEKNADGTDKFTPEANKKYYLSLLKAAGYSPVDNVPDDQQTVQLGKAGLFPHVVQYVEMMFATHETNHDGVLEKSEALAAFPVFQNLIGLAVQKYPTIKPEDYPGVFIYLIKFKREPKNLAEKIKFAAFVKDKEQKEWDIQSNRHDLGEVFNYIAAASKPKPPPPPPSAPPAEPQPNPQP
jgi:hypothetical protein